MNGPLVTPLATNNTQMPRFAIPAINGLHTSAALMPNGQAAGAAQSPEYMRLKLNYMMLQ